MQKNDKDDSLDDGSNTNISGDNDKFVTDLSFVEALLTGSKMADALAHAPLEPKANANAS